MYPGNRPILHQQLAKFWNQQDRWDRPDGTLVLTPEYLIFNTPYQPQRLCFPLQQITALQITRVWKIVPALRFQFNQQVFIFTGLHSFKTLHAKLCQAQQPA